MPTNLPYIEDYSHRAPTTMGCYAAVKFDFDTNKRLLFYMQSLRIRNMTVVSDLHSTLIYSKKPLPNWVSPGPIDPPIEVDPKTYKLLIWETGDEDSIKRTLVLSFECPYMTRRWHLAMAMGATWDFPSYIAHVTLSSDVGPDFDLDNARVPDFPLAIINEYCEALADNFGTDPNLFKGDNAPTTVTSSEIKSDDDLTDDKEKERDAWMAGLSARLKQLADDRIKGVEDHLKGLGIKTGSDMDYILKFILNG